MPALQRSISLRGPRFWREGETIMFVNHLDGSTQIGPRVATAEDANTYSEAFEAHLAGVEPEPIKPLLAFETPPDADLEPAPRRRAKE